MKVLVVLVVVLTWLGNAVAWEVVTPLGIRVKASQSTMISTTGTGRPSRV